MNKILLFILFFAFTLNATSQTVDFTFESSNGSFCSPSTILFKQNCTGNPKSFIWNFGNNKYGNKANETVTYTSGTYSVQLVAVFANTTLKITKTITVNPAVTASIKVDKNSLCKPGVINFTGSSSGNTSSYEWNFGDGTAPVTSTTNTVSHNFSTFATDTVTLKTTGSTGCGGTATAIVRVKALPISVNVSKSRGCVPSVINLSASVTTAPNTSVTSYTWNYGDGSPVFTSSDSTASHTYTVVGSYVPQISIVSSDGCNNSLNFLFNLAFGNPPTNQVVYTKKDSICGSDSAVFVSKATNANRYFWEFGDGTTASVSDTIVKHKYDRVGKFTVRVKPYYNECDAPTKTFPFTVIGVIAKYGFANTCSDKNIYTLRDTSSGTPTARLWDFGDGIQEANTVNPVHTFPVSGQFKATLLLQDAVSHCADNISKIFYTAQPQLYTPDTAICRRDSIHFSILKNYTDTAIRYMWSVPDSVTGPVPNASITVAAGNHGKFNGTVIIDHGGGSCRDTITLARPLSVGGPNVRFTSPGEICSSTPLVVTNQSAPFFAADSIQSWSWDYGDGTPVVTDLQPAPFLYESDGTYTLQLTAIDKNGCSDTLAKTVQVDPTPFLHLSVTRDSICFGEADTMIAFHNNDLLWTASNNISCSTCDTVVVSPQASTTYFATATNSFNCSVKDSIHIGVTPAFKAAIVPSDLYICRNETAVLDVNPKGKKIAWSPAAGLSDPAVYSPVVTGIQTTSYTATLTDSTGCLNTSSAIVNVHVKSLPVVNAGPDQVFSKGTSFTIKPAYSSNVTAYLWSPATTLSCSNCASPSGVADGNQLYIIQVTSDSGCVASDTIQVAIDCKSSFIFMPKAFTPNNDNLNDVFYPMTTGIRSVTRFTIYNRLGQVMYEAHNFLPNNKDFGWDGRFRGVSQPAGGYVYVIETICVIGEKINQKGAFLLLR